MWTNGSRFNLSKADMILTARRNNENCHFSKKRFDMGPIYGVICDGEFYEFPKRHSGVCQKIKYDFILNEVYSEEDTLLIYSFHVLGRASIFPRMTLIFGRDDSLMTFLSKQKSVDTQNQMIFVSYTDRKFSRIPLVQPSTHNATIYRSSTQFNIELQYK